jgi:hypothetical protein
LFFILMPLFNTSRVANFAQQFKTFSSSKPPVQLPI